MTGIPKPSDGQTDPYLWLEEIAGDKADAWVRAANSETESLLVDEQFEADRLSALAILDSDQRIPYITRRGASLYNTWTDRQNPRGLWRRTTLESYDTPAPQWETVLDIDALGRREGKPWIFGGACAFPPQFNRALVRLSQGGSDAVEIREFDLVAKMFIAEGFFLPTAKCWAVWEDADTILFGHALGEGQVTNSGYARTIRRLRRGQALAQAETVFEIGGDDMGLWAYVQHDPDSRYTLIRRQIDFFRCHWFVEYPGQPRHRLDLPETATCDRQGNRFAIVPREDWHVGDQVIPAGALAMTNLDAFIAGDRRMDILFTPGPRRALASTTLTPSAAYLTINENIISTIHVARPKPNGGWEVSARVGLPKMASLAVSTLDVSDAPVSDDIVIVAMSFTEPPTLAIHTGASAPAIMKCAPAAFNSLDMITQQHEAVAADGVAIPYFLTGRRGALDGAPKPAILYGYGGFEVIQGPSYLSQAGKFWLERGGLYAIANIRGGGEFGPSWHAAGRRALKGVSHDDFASVAQDLAARGFTHPSMLACWGGSNGGLLVGNMITRYPQLFGAAICAVPLLDMARYTKLLAGASWIAEYGDPDDPEEWAFIEKFSPYHTVRAGIHYPKILFTTSRNDDRVHPGHARKMAARMRELGHEILFYENIEGGHGGAADNAQAANRSALCYSFLRRTIGATLGSAVGA